MSGLPRVQVIVALIMAKYACRTAPNYDYDERYSTYRALQLGGGFIVGVQCPFPPTLHESSRLSRQSTQRHPRFITEYTGGPQET